MLGLVVLTCGLTFLFATLIVRTDIDAIQADWANRRCELPVLIASANFKPANDSRSGTEFAKDNFAFCTQQIAKSVLQTAFGPLLAIAGQQTGAVQSMTGPLNSLRAMLKTAMGTFSEWLDRIYKQFQITSTLSAINFHHLSFAMGRIGAIVTSIVYLGLSASQFVQNTFDFALNVILIFIGILAALIIILFFVLFPSIPIIITMLTILAAAGLATGGMAGAFCIDPEAHVLLEDHTTKPLKDVRIGDVLAKGHDGTPTIVTGVLTADASGETLYSLYGVILSGAHRVYFKKQWVLVREHPDAIRTDKALSQLICLNTSNHCVPIISLQGILLASDWEEFSTEAGQKAWIDWVNMKLNGGHHTLARYPTTVPLLSPRIKVYKEGKGWTPIRDLRLGDHIGSATGYATVKGLYRGQLHTSHPPPPEWMSDGVWSFTGRFWIQSASGLSEAEDGHRVEGLQVVTDAEEFAVHYQGQPILVRDFTEVGLAGLEQTYSMIDSFLHKK